MFCSQPLFNPLFTQRSTGFPCLAPDVRRDTGTHTIVGFIGIEAYYPRWWLSLEAKYGKWLLVTPWSEGNSRQFCSFLSVSCTLFLLLFRSFGYPVSSFLVSMFEVSIPSKLNHVPHGQLFFLKFLFIDFRERKGGGWGENREVEERETSICCSTYLCIYWLILVCALTGDSTRNLDVLGRHSNQLSYPASQLFILNQNI